MRSSKIRMDCLDFVFGVSNFEEYFIPSLVLIQSILENNLWANQIQISIFYENWSAEQKDVYEQLIDNFNQSQGKKFVILNLFDVTKLKFETYNPHHGANHTYKIEGIKFIQPISNWIFSMDANQLNVRSLESLISKLNQDYSDCYIVGSLFGPFLNPFDGSYYDAISGPLVIINTNFFYIENGILDKYIETHKEIKDTYPTLFGNRMSLNSTEATLGIALLNEPVVMLNAFLFSPTSLDQIPDSIYFLKWTSQDLSPWNQEFPDNALKQLWLEYASKNPMSNNFQISYPYKTNNSFFHKIQVWFITRSIYIYNFLLHWVGKISPKMFQKLYTIYLKSSTKN